MNNLPKIEDFVEDYLGDLMFVNKLDFPEREEIIATIREYAKLAIIADRENVAEHAEVDVEMSMGQRTGYTSVDRDSIINAPNIELL